jgi:hypothetical protein
VSSSKVLKEPQIGDVFYTPYIWDRQDVKDSEKDRPCCVALRLKSRKTDLKSGELWNVALLAITKDGNESTNVKIQIPAEEIARIEKFSYTDVRYLVVSEHNIGLNDSEFFNEYEYRGTFSKEFMKGVVYPAIKKLFI